MRVNTETVCDHYKEKTMCTETRNWRLFYWLVHPVIRLSGGETTVRIPLNTHIFAKSKHTRAELPLGLKRRSASWAEGEYRDLGRREEVRDSGRRDLRTGLRELILMTVADWAEEEIPKLGLD